MSVYWSYSALRNTTTLRNRVLMEFLSLVPSLNKNLFSEQISYSQNVSPGMFAFTVVVVALICCHLAFFDSLQP